MYCAYVRSISMYVLCTPSKRSLTKKNGGFATYGTTYNICIMNNISATYCNICANERGASAACCRHVARMLHACCIYMMFRLQATKERRWKIRQRGQKTHTPPPKHTHTPPPPTTNVRHLQQKKIGEEHEWAEGRTNEAWLRKKSPKASCATSSNTFFVFLFLA